MGTIFKKSLFDCRDISDLLGEMESPYFEGDRLTGGFKMGMRRRGGRLLKEAFDNFFDIDTNAGLGNPNHRSNADLGLDSSNGLEATGTLDVDVIFNFGPAESGYVNPDSLQFLYYQNNLSDGTFTRTLTNSASPYYSVVVGDVDRDGDLDIVSSTFVTGSNTNILLVGDDLNNFTELHFEGLPPYAALDSALADFDGNGYLDLIVTFDASDETPVWLFLNKGILDGDQVPTFTASQVATLSGTGQDIAIGDIDGDGHLDAVIANGVDASQLLLNSGDQESPTFEVQNIPVGLNYAVDLGDIDGDGAIDIVVANNQVSKNSQIAYNLGDTDGDGEIDFQVDDLPDTKAATVDVAIADLTGDGLFDIYLANTFGDSDKIAIRNPTGYTVQDIPEQSGTDSSQTKIADMDSDGDLDILVGKIETGPQLLINNGVKDDLLSIDIQNLPSKPTDDGIGVDGLWIAAGDLDGDSSELYLTPSGLPYLGRGLPYTEDFGVGLSSNVMTNPVSGQEVIG